MIPLLKLISVLFIILLVMTVSYRTFVNNLPKSTVQDTSKLKTILEEYKIKFANKSYAELVSLMKDKGRQPHLFTIREHGVIYKLEVSSYWVNEYQQDGDIIIYLSIYKGFTTSQNSLRDTIIKSK